LESRPASHSAAGGGHLLADYAANGSALMTHLRDLSDWEYLL
jgi:hypothetical protein